MKFGTRNGKSLFRAGSLRKVAEVISLLPFSHKRRLRVFENRVLRRMFGKKEDEVTGDWRKLHSEELHNLYS
jgi:hypothetical protein